MWKQSRRRPGTGPRSCRRVPPRIRPCGQCRPSIPQLHSAPRSRNAAAIAPNQACSIARSSRSWQPAHQLSSVEYKSAQLDLSQKSQVAKVYAQNRRTRSGKIRAPRPAAFHPLPAQSPGQDSTPPIRCGLLMEPHPCAVRPRDPAAAPCRGREAIPSDPAESGQALPCAVSKRLQPEPCD